MGHRAAGLAIFVAAIGAASLDAVAANAAPGNDDKALAAVVASPTRSSQNVARDVYRHPQQSLSFWGLKPGMAILEIWPGTGYQHIGDLRAGRTNVAIVPWEAHMARKPLKGIMEPP